MTHEFEFSSTLRPMKWLKIVIKGQRTVKALCGRQVVVEQIAHGDMPTCSGCEEHITTLAGFELLAG